MQKIVISVIIFLCLTVSAFAQDMMWSRTYGGSSWDVGHSVQQTKDGGYIVAGHTGSFDGGWYDVYLIKTDARGDTLWSRTYGESGSGDWGFSVQQTTDGGYIVTGQTYSFGAGEPDVYLVKTNAFGDIFWNRTYGGSEGDVSYSVEQTGDAGYIVAGETGSFGAGKGDVYLIKTDSLGNTLWSRTYGGGDWEYGSSLHQTSDGGYIVGATTSSFGAGERDIYLVKTDSLGNTLWTRSYGGSDAEEFLSVQQATDGGYIVTGWTNSFGAGGLDVYLIKTDSFGNTLWSRTYGGGGWEYGASLHQTTDGGYVVAGGTQSFGVAVEDVYVIKTDSTGDILWTCTYGGSNWDIAFSVQQTTDGGYVVVGYTESFGAGEADIILTKLDSLGNTCIGEFVSSTSMSVSCSVTSPATIVTSPSTIVTSPATIVASPATVVTTVCEWPASCGDLNGDGEVNISDIVHFINYLFQGGDPPQCPTPYTSCADGNGDGDVALADVVYLINYVLKSGPPPIC